MSVGIDELLDMLSWNSDEETQKRGIELAREVECYSVFLQPSGLKHNKDVWENCAKVICGYSDEKLNYCIDGALDWIEDLNWPGAELVLERLTVTDDTDLLALCLTLKVKEALVNDRREWLNNMAYLVANNEKISHKLPKDVYEVLYDRFPEPEE